MPYAARFAQTAVGRWLISRSRPDPATKPPFRIENEFFTVEVAQDGTLTLNDRRTGVVYPSLNQFVDGGDCGDEYNYSPPASDQVVTARLKGARVDRGAVCQTIKVSLELQIPAELSSDRKARSGKTVTIPIISQVTLTSGVPRLDIQTEVDNGDRNNCGLDHRLRVHFPAPFTVTDANYDGHFEVVRRLLGVPASDETWAEQPRPEAPQRLFTDISDWITGLLVANRGLPEVEVLKQSDGKAEIALTLLRCVGWLSRDDLSTRKSHAGPFLATPQAQMIGKWTFDYSVIPHSGGDTILSYQQAYGFSAPLRAVSTPPHDGKLPAKGSFIQVSPPEFILSAVKTAEDGQGWLVRGYNITAEEIPVTLQPWRRFPHAARITLAEQPLSTLAPAADGSVTFTARGHEIVSVLFRE